MEEALDIRQLPESAITRLLDNINLIKSDHYTTEVLENLVEKPMNATQQTQLLNMVDEHVSSGHYRAEILSDFMDEQPLHQESFAALQRAISNINSDNYKTNVLTELANLSALTDEQVIGLLATAKSINSDHYLSEAVVAFSGHANSRGEKVKTAYRDTCQAINSETYYGRAMKALRG
ncbi:MAG: hypothetical protein AAGJ82_15195, partial [Bacteroidota bacterium]